MSTAEHDHPWALAEGERVPANPGRVVSVRGSVVDVRFDRHLPPIYSVHDEHRYVLLLIDNIFQFIRAGSEVSGFLSFAPERD